MLIGVSEGASGIEHFKERVKRLQRVADTGLVSGSRRLLLPAGGVTVVAGSPGQGKTSLMLNLLHNLLKADREGRRFHFFSYEKSDIYLALKLLMIGSNVVLAEDNLGAFVEHFQRASWLGKDETNGHLARAVDAFGAWVGERRLIIDDRGHNLHVLQERIRTDCTPGETGAIFIDYVQKVPLPAGSNVRDRYAQLKEVSGVLLRLANELQVPVVVGAQLNRGVRGWPPTLEHIRESSDIGQDASLVLALKREQLKGELGERLKVHVVKNRRGPAHMDLTFAFRGATYRVDTLAKAKAPVRDEAVPSVEGGTWLPLAADEPAPFVIWS